MTNYTGYQNTQRQEIILKQYEQNRVTKPKLLGASHFCKYMPTGTEAWGYKNKACREQANTQVRAGGLPFPSGR